MCQIFVVYISCISWTHCPWNIELTNILWTNCWIFLENFGFCLIYIGQCVQESLDNVSNNHVRLRQDFFALDIICPICFPSKSHFVQPNVVCLAPAVPAVPTFWSPASQSQHYVVSTKPLDLHMCQRLLRADRNEQRNKYLKSELQYFRWGS